MKLLINKLRDNAIVPSRASEASAGLDICACLDSPVTINVGAIEIIPTGIAVAPELRDTVTLLFGRSGLGAKHGIVPANAVGVIDSDYRGEVCVALVNHGTEPFEITHGMRIAQLVCVPCIFAEPIVSDLDSTERGANGFGSSGC